MAQVYNCPFHVKVAETEDILVKNLGDVLKCCANRSLEKSETFRLGLSAVLQLEFLASLLKVTLHHAISRTKSSIVCFALTGGSLVQLLTRALVEFQLNTKCWKFFFCDERYVADDHQESTYWAYKTQMLNQLPDILDSQFVKANTSLPLDECANDYETRVKAEFGTNCPEFDLLLLGMGPDGHTCSLFPEQPASLTETQRLVIPIRDSPKPPPERITFTLPLINNAKNVVFVVTGAGKAAVVNSVFGDRDKQFPAAWIEPKHGELTLLADAGAAKTFLTHTKSC